MYEDISKPNRAELRRVMGMYDLSPEEVAEIIGKSAATINQYRSISGAYISDSDLATLKAEMKNRYPESAIK